MNHHPRSRFERRMYLRDERTRRRARRRTYKRIWFRPHFWRTIRRTRRCCWRYAVRHNVIDLVV